MSGWPADTIARHRPSGNELSQDPSHRSTPLEEAPPRPFLAERRQLDRHGRERTASGAFPRGPLPRPAFRSFLATAVDPSPQPRGRGGCAGSAAPCEPVRSGIEFSLPRAVCGGGPGRGAASGAVGLRPSSPECRSRGALSPAGPFARSSRRPVPPTPGRGGCAGSAVRSESVQSGIEFSLPRAVCGGGPGRGAPTARTRPSPA
jgi:hypothetical protein